MRARMPLFMVSVGGISIASLIMFNLASDRLGNQMPALKTLNDYATRRNG